MTTRADIALLTQAFERVAPILDEAATSFIEAAPNDPQRQLALQSKLMVAVVATFMQSMPAMSEADFGEIFRFAAEGVARAQEDVPAGELN